MVSVGDNVRAVPQRTDAADISNYTSTGNVIQNAVSSGNAQTDYEVKRAEVSTTHTSASGGTHGGTGASFSNSADYNEKRTEMHTSATGGSHSGGGQGF